MWQRPQWEVGSHSARQEISYFRGTEYLLQTFKGVAARLCTEQDKSGGEIKLFKNYFNIILPSTAIWAKCWLPFHIHYYSIFVPQTSFASYMFCQSHIGCFHHPSNMVGRILIMKHDVMYLSTSSCELLFPNFKHSASSFPTKSPQKFVYSLDTAGFKFTNKMRCKGVVKSSGLHTVRWQHVTCTVFTVLLKDTFSMHVQNSTKISLFYWTAILSASTEKKNVMPTEPIT